MSDKHFISKKSSWTSPLIIVLALALSMWGLDRGILSDKTNIDRIDGRVLTQTHLERSVVNYLEQAGINSSHPQYADYFNQVSNHFIVNWQMRAKLASHISLSGLDPNSDLIREELKKELKTSTLSSKDIERAAQSFGLNESQYILQVRDAWRLENYQALLKDSEIQDTDSTHIQLAINEQERFYTRYKLNDIKPSISTKMISEYYNAHLQDFITPGEYHLEYIEITPDQFKDKKATRASADAYFKKNPGMVPAHTTLALQISKNGKSTLSQKEIQALRITKSDKKQILALHKKGLKITRSQKDIDTLGLQKIDANTYTYKTKIAPSDEEIIHVHQAIKASDLFMKEKPHIQEFSFINPESLAPLAQKYQVKTQTITVSEGNLPATWKEPGLIELITSRDIQELKYNSPVIMTREPSFIVFRLKSMTPAKQKTQAEAEQAIREILQATQEEVQKNLLSIQVMRQLAMGKISNDLAEKLTKSQFTVNKDNFDNYSSVAPIVNSFLLYQTENNPTPSFSLNSSVASLDKVSYPSLKSLKTQNVDQPAYLDSFQFLLQQL